MQAPAEINDHYNTAVNHLGMILEKNGLTTNVLLHCLKIDLDKKTADMRDPENPLFPYIQAYQTTES